MNISDIFNLKPGVLFRGIEKINNKMILSTEKWNIGINLPDIRHDFYICYFSEKKNQFLDEKYFIKFESKTSDQLLKLYKEVFDSKHVINSFYYSNFEAIKLNVGEPIGMFTGIITPCLINKSSFLIQVLRNKEIGWLVLQECFDEIYEII